ncbi:hypothetical protein HCN44_007184 [Aphidius gifuensis]|uniref:Uncharacterized protein n=1 Tax=Aphidius gifuensis TaxID=684658 RepID=A0A835CLK1_APHGI|nr:uncharacterized protein LOC122857684 [Aphidius gifuensis]KAF7988874.1 hypothetical protein HCN44_007184 [Aphidius gifuensis]
MNCKNENCANIVKVDISPALHVFIELGVREGIEQDPAMISCRLKDIPSVLDVGNTKYRLAGVLHYAHEHFTAYCRRIKGQWNLYDDMTPKKQFIQRANPKITPVGAIYILINP